ncbi:MAG: LacI family transcriptional regulator [Dysgonamonadaceae bacterium]|jgi:LacI family transcriptional regulator|nr:LacI family transcriptional regulator [Dysgonamonadaceae bacterium]
MAAQKININDIATKTGLSISTVSRVLNGKAEQFRIGKKSQQKVNEVAKELKYIPNKFAASLRTGKSNTIALIIPTLQNPFFADLASNINAEIRRFGFTTMISDSDENFEIEKWELRQMISRNVDGLIIVPNGNQWDHIKSLYDRGLPIICIDRYFEDSELPFVSTDNYEGAYNATKHLIENGHSRITCIQGVQYSTPNKLRVKGFKIAMEEAGFHDYIVTGDDFSLQNGYLETELLFHQKQMPTAIFTLSNTIALGCMKALKEMNIRIPDDISLITFDDHPYLNYLETPLSCIAQPVNDISKIAVKFLLSQINKEENRIKQVLLKPQMILKKSVRRII